MIDESKLRFKNIKNLKIEQYINKSTEHNLDIKYLEQINKFYEDKKKLIFRYRRLF